VRLPCCSQYVALGAVEAGRDWVDGQVAGLAGNRAALLDALSPLGPDAVVGGEGAIYLFARLPPGEGFRGSCLLACTHTNTHK
jgi:katanin p60 ATPase-containing subunit A1